MDKRVSIGQVKRDISDLVNRVAYGGERIVLTSRGKPKAALVSIQDYEKLHLAQDQDRQTYMMNWLERVKALSTEILNRRGGQMIDVDALLASARDDLEARSE
ncbi:MAG: type II toxin-antitoxin system Phd/YefM family antitoxin [Anaerolineales bacterium]|jgi:prevent-host-death family protein